MDEGKELRGRIILITGATGFTGMHACRYFAELGMLVAGLTHKQPPDTDIPGVRYYTCDLLDPLQITETVQKIAPHYVLHLGGKNSVTESWNHPLLYMETNVFSLLYLLEALRASSDCRVLVAGSRLSVPLSSPYRLPHPYSLSKSLQKVLSLSWEGLFGQDVMVAEPSNLVGPGPSTGICSLLGRRFVQAELGKADAPFRLSSRSERRDFLDVRDAVRAYGYLLAYGESGKEYPVCTGVERSLHEVVESVKRTTKGRIVLEWEDSDSDPEDSDAGPDSGDSLSGGIHTPVLPSFLQGLGWKPLISFQTSLHDVIDYFRGTKGELR